jgi:hypothetical protein
VRFALFPAIFLLLSACSEDLPDPVPGPSTPLTVGEARQVELRFVRFDVSNYEQVMTRQDVLELPRDVQERLWMLDLDLSSGPTTPQLLDNALSAIKRLDPEELSVPARNLQRLLLMTPDNADLTGTSLEHLTELAPLLGIEPARVLADLMGIDVEDTVLSPEVVARTILEQVIESHPKARTRLGPRTADNPQGVYPVKPGAMPITLSDAVTNFASLSERFGPITENGVFHPGFISGGTRARVLTDDFRMIVRANANALPYKGIELATTAEASVNSVKSQIAGLFDFDDPDWLVIEGLVPGAPVIESLTFRIVEQPEFVRGGSSPIPSGMGNSPGWKLPSWSIERVLLGASQRAFAEQQASLSYFSPGHAEPIFSATVEQGWQDMQVAGNLGSPPAPCYLWDLVSEVAQVRLHDGGLAEGEASVEFTLHDVPAGTDTTVIEQTIKDNLRADPQILRDIASEVVDTTRGAADFYYYRSQGVDAADWLFFVAESDLELDAEGEPVRPYGYRHPGFFADEDLTEQLSSFEDLSGDVEHQKVRVTQGDVVYVEDAARSVYRLEIGTKPSLNRLGATITRVR